MKNHIIIVFVLGIIISCTKENYENNDVVQNSNSENNSLYMKKGNDLRNFVYIGTGPGTVEPDCIGKGGNCLPDLIVTGIVGYTDLVGAIENNTQQEFFNNNSYSSVFGIEENHQIQDALEKGHLKIKLVKFGNKDFNLFIKPQHEKFEGNKLANKVVLSIPVVH